MFRFLVAAMGVAAVSAFSGPTTMTVASPVARASDVTMIGKKFGTPKKTVAKKEAPKSFLEQASVSTPQVVEPSIWDTARTRMRLTVQLPLRPQFGLANFASAPGSNRGKGDERGVSYDRSKPPAYDTRSQKFTVKAKSGKINPKDTSTW